MSLDHQPTDNDTTAAGDPSRIRRRLRRLFVRRQDDGSERGASLVEYALLVALIGVVCIAAITQFGGSNGEGIDRSADSIVNAGL